MKQSIDFQCFTCFYSFRFIPSHHTNPTNIMIRSDFDTHQGRTTNEWEAQQIGDYIALIGSARELIEHLAGNYLAACTVIEENRLPVRLCADDARTHMAIAMETNIDLKSLAEYLADQRQTAQIVR